jgi:hypothetical protein
MGGQVLNNLREDEQLSSFYAIQGAKATRLLLSRFIDKLG